MLFNFHCFKIHSVKSYAARSNEFFFVGALAIYFKLASTQAIC